MRLQNWPAAVEIFNEELLNLHRGQGMDLFWRDTLTTPTEEEYLQMISNKTGGLFRLMIRLMMTQSRTGIDLVPFAEVMGLIFQIQDDYKNLTSAQVSAISIKQLRTMRLGADYVTDELSKRLLRRSDGGQILLPHHPRHPSQPLGQQRGHEHPQAQNRGSCTQGTCCQIHV